MSQLFATGGQSIGPSALASVLPLNIQGRFPLELNSLESSSWTPRSSQESYLAPQFESINFSVLSLLYGPVLTSVHDYWKNHSFEVSKVMSLLFNMLSRFIIAFLPRSMRLLISWQQSTSR